jgi:hypothetical protein
MQSVPALWKTGGTRKSDARSSGFLKPPGECFSAMKFAGTFRPPSWEFSSQTSSLRAFASHCLKIV